MNFYQKLFEKIIVRDSVEVQRKKFSNQKVIFTNGCFDILHPGHVEYLARARDLGDLLWIGLNADESVKRLKGPSRPLNLEMDRAIVLAGLGCVDYITIFSEDTPLELLRILKPDVHTKGGDYIKEKLPEYPLVQSYGGEVVILPFLPGKSTTSILEKAKTSI